MMKKALTVLFLFFTIASFGQVQPIAIIPEPVSLTKTQGTFTLPSKIVIDATSPMVLKESVNALKRRITTATGLPVSVTTNSGSGAIRLVLNKSAKPNLGNEGYTLSVKPNQVVVTANEPAGVFYGVQSLLQLFPKEIESNSVVHNVKWQLPAVEITDYPRFGWRGLMFDVARHFYGKEDVKRFIDEMVRYKYNLLHMHLADDEGWRLEIKGLH
jgi:hexosaminidase